MIPPDGIVYLRRGSEAEPVAVAVDVGDAVARDQVGRVESQVLQLERAVDDQAGAERVAALIAAVVAVVVAEEFELVAGDQRDQALGGGVGLAVFIEGVSAGDRSVGIVFVKDHLQIDELAVEQGRDAADSGPAVVGVRVGDEIVGDELPVEGQPGPVVVEQQATLVELEDVVEAEVDVALAVVGEDVELHRLHQAHSSSLSSRTGCLPR